MTLRKEFYHNILISGGTSMIPGFPTRLKEEVESRFKEHILKGAATNTSSVKIRVIDPPTRKYNVFIGASIIAKETEGIRETWTTNKEYQEKGKHRLAQELNAKIAMR